jgi:hypothetical protein
MTGDIRSRREVEAIERVLEKLCGLLGPAVERADADPNRIPNQRAKARRVILAMPDARLIDWMNKGNLPMDCLVKAHKQLIAEGAVEPREKQA